VQNRCSRAGANQLAEVLNKCRGSAEVIMQVIVQVQRFFRCSEELVQSWCSGGE